MEAKLAPEIQVQVFEGDLKECEKRVNEMFKLSTTRRILDVSVADHAILVVYEVR